MWRACRVPTGDAAAFDISVSSMRSHDRFVFRARSAGLCPCSTSAPIRVLMPFALRTRYLGMRARRAVVRPGARERNIIPPSFGGALAYD